MNILTKIQSDIKKLWLYVNFIRSNPSSGGTGAFADITGAPEDNAALQAALDLKQRKRVFNVLDYGAVGDGVADNADAFTDAIAATPEGGQLAIPEGEYLFLTGIVVNKNIRIVGANLAGTKLQTANNITLIECTKPSVVIENILVEYTGVSDATSAIGILMNADALSLQGFSLQNVYVINFYDNIDVQAGQHWEMRCVNLISAERFNLRIRNTLGADGGDWNVSNSYFYQHGADTDGIGVYQESSGGGKFVNCKWNGELAIGYYGQLSSTTIVMFSNCSFENFLASAIYITNTSLVTISGCEFAPYAAITGPMIEFDNVDGAVISNNIFLTSDPSSVAIKTSSTSSSISVCSNSAIGFSGDPYSFGGSSVTPCGEAGQFITSGNDAYFSLSGKLGIGINSPLAKLEVLEETADDNVVARFSSGDSTNDNAKVSRITLAGVATTYGSVGHVVSGHETNGTSPASFIYLENRNAAGTIAERFRVASTGNVLVNAGTYYNFGSTLGSSGYGIRDNAGTIEVKNSGGSWAAPGGGGSSQWTTSGSNIYYNTGNVGINNASPSTRLSVLEDAGLDNNVAVFSSGSSANTTAKIGEIVLSIPSSGNTGIARITWGNETDGNSPSTWLGFKVRNSVGAETERLRIKPEGDIRMSAYGAGTATFDASGNITSVSDERLKNIQGDYTTGLGAILKLNPIIYKYNKKSGLDTEHDYAGFSAQNVNASIPLATGRTSEGYLTLQDRALMAAMVNAIKEQQSMIDDLKKQVAVLKKKK